MVMYSLGHGAFMVCAGLTVGEVCILLAQELD